MPDENATDPRPSLYTGCRGTFQVDKPERPDEEKVLKTYFPNGRAMQARPGPAECIRVCQGRNAPLRFKCKAFPVTAQWRGQQ